LKRVRRSADEADEREANSLVYQLSFRFDVEGDVGQVRVVEDARAVPKAIAGGDALDVARVHLVAGGGSTRGVADVDCGGHEAAENVAEAAERPADADESCA